MSFIIGVRFAEVGKIYYFDPGKLELQLDDKVIVETAGRGIRRSGARAARGRGKPGHKAAEKGIA